LVLAGDNRLESMCGVGGRPVSVVSLRVPHGPGRLRIPAAPTVGMAGEALDEQPIQEPAHRECAVLRSLCGGAGIAYSWPMELVVISRGQVAVVSMLHRIQQAIVADGFSFVPASGMADVLTTAGSRDWEGFSRSWDDLGLDAYMADGGRYRRRRHACFSLSRHGVVRKPHQPHYQSRDYNRLNGGIERWFDPVDDAVADHAVLQAVLRTGFDLFDPLTPSEVRPPAWHTEVHQFRIEASPAQPGCPTPEGMHRDGVDWVLVMLIQRENVARGTTTILDAAGRTLGSFTLTAPMDVAVVDDARVFHGVTPVLPVDATRPAHRDVLVVTLRR